MFKPLITKIKTKKIKVGIIGLGYVGLPLAIRFLNSKIKVLGIENNTNKIQLIKKGVCYIENKKFRNDKYFKEFRNNVTNEYSKLSNVDIVIVCLPTPLTKSNKPDISILKKCALKITKFLKEGQIFILESTVYPGATVEIFKILNKEGKFKLGNNFFLSFSPERENPGDKLFSYKYTPKVVSGYTTKCSKIAFDIYKLIARKVFLAKTIKVAEMSKLLENTFRAVNIGLVNEIKIICDKVGINVHKVINLAKTKPYGFTKFDPGPGIGGHCIPIDPFFLSWYAEKNNVSSNFIKYSGIINKKIKDWIFKKILDIEKISKKKLNLFFLGVTYKKNINDTRESPAIYLIDKCLKNKINVKFNDPFVQTIEVNKKKINSTSLNSNLNSIDVAILTADHDQYNYEKIYNKFKIIIDTRGRYQNLKNSKIIHA